MFNILYSFGIFLFGKGIRLAAFFNRKAKLWIGGRKGLFQRVEKALKTDARPDHPILWFHVSSLGEFEQGRPLIENIRKNFPSYRILLTFFSPSGYEIRKDYDQADFVFYLPLDTRRNVKRWIEMVNPALVVFVKYDYWYNFLDALHRNDIPVIFISALFRPAQLFFKKYGAWFRRHLQNIEWFFVQDERSEKLLHSIGIKNLSVCGDTRFDRVYSIAANVKPFPLIAKFCEGNRIVVCGSTWKEDEDRLLPMIGTMKPGIKFIIAPHDVSQSRIEELTSRLQQPWLRYSEMNNDNLTGKVILIINTVGILSQLYQYADLAYIGGGFGSGIHNIQEPITFGVPVIFGPRYHKFKEAVDLIEQEGAFSISNAPEFEEKTGAVLSDPNLRRQMAERCRNYVEQHRGATARILEGLANRHLLKK